MSQYSSSLKFSSEELTHLKGELVRVTQGRGFLRRAVMEGKGVLFKKFAGIDVFDLEFNEKDLDKLVDHIAALEPTFGGINLETSRHPTASTSNAGCANA